MELSGVSKDFLGIGLFCFGILIQSAIISKRKKIDKHDLIDFVDTIDEPYEIYSSKNTQTKINEEKDYKNLNKQSDIIEKFDNPDKNTSNEKELVIKRFDFKSDEEILYENSNPNDIVIKILCEDEEKIYYKLESVIVKKILSNPNKNINLILETNGGNFITAIKLCNILYIYKKLNPECKVKIYVPKYSFSAGTYITLMADELYLNDYAFLSPVDVQINLEQDFYSVNELIEYSEDEKSKIIDLQRNSLILTYCAKRYHNLSIKCFNKFIFSNCNKYTPKVRKNIIDKFVNTKLPHTTCFDKEDLEELGIKIKGNVPNEIMEIYEKTISIK